MATSKLGSFLAGKAASIDFASPPPASTRAPNEMKTGPGQTMKLQSNYNAALNDIELLKAELDRASARELQLADLHEVPGRRRRLTKEQYVELLENLRVNPLVTPISVRKRKSGGYEIVSGHNRVWVYRDLDRTSIMAVVLDADDTQADLGAFYANLMQPRLPDFEKYIGFKMVITRFPELGRDDIAKNAGISKTQLSFLMAFEELPADALENLQNRPEAIGADAAYKLAVISKGGRAKKVTEAIAKVIAGDLDQSQAIKFASENPAPKKKPEPIRIRSGKTTYCDVRRTDKVLRLDFKTAEEAEAIEAAVVKLLDDRAKLAK